MAPPTPDQNVYRARTHFREQEVGNLRNQEKRNQEKKEEVAVGVGVADGQLT